MRLKIFDSPGKRFANILVRLLRVQTHGVSQREGNDQIEELIVSDATRSMKS